MPDASPPIRRLIPVDYFVRAGEPLSVDLVYANAAHPENIFKTALYHPDARLVLHEDLARIILLAARTLYDACQWHLVLKDGLRPVEAQNAMAETEIVKAHPEWLVEPRMLSSAGQGGHPRAMAVDVSAMNKDGQPINMGTTFDTMTPESARDYTGFDAEILENRHTLERAMVEAAQRLNLLLLPLPNEWWDFRFPAATYKDIAPLSDAALPGPLKMCAPRTQDDEFEDHLAALDKRLRLSI